MFGSAQIDTYVSIPTQVTVRSVIILMRFRYFLEAPTCKQISIKKLGNTVRETQCIEIPIALEYSAHFEVLFHKSTKAQKLFQTLRKKSSIIEAVQDRLIEIHI